MPSQLIKQILKPLLLKLIQYKPRTNVRSERGIIELSTVITYLSMSMLFFNGLPEKDKETLDHNIESLNCLFFSFVKERIHRLVIKLSQIKVVLTLIIYRNFDYKGPRLFLKYIIYLLLYMKFQKIKNVKLIIFLEHFFTI